MLNQINPKVFEHSIQYIATNSRLQPLSLTKLAALTPYAKKRTQKLLCTNFCRSTSDIQVPEKASRMIQVMHRPYI